MKTPKTGSGDGAESETRARYPDQPGTEKGLNSVLDDATLTRWHYKIPLFFTAGVGPAPGVRSAAPPDSSPAAKRPDVGIIPSQIRAAEGPWAVTASGPRN